MTSFRRLTGSGLSVFEPGKTVRGLDLSVYKVVSRVASSNKTTVKLANSVGTIVSLPNNFVPVSAPMAHLASFCTFHLAYNKDFDLYVRAYCERAGLPIPVGPNGKPFEWAKWLQKTIFPKLIIPFKGRGYEDVEEIKDEAIHEMLFHVFSQINILGNFHTAIKNFAPEIQKLPESQQLTVYLTSYIKGRIAYTNEKLKEIVPDEEVNMMAPGEEEGEEINILDTPEYAHSPESLGLESEQTVKEFRNDFYEWLLETQQKKGARAVISLFDIYWDYVKDSTSSMDTETRPNYIPARNSLESVWMEKTRLSVGSLYSYIGRMAEYMEQFIRESRHSLGEENIFVKLIDSIHHQREKLRVTTASVKQASPKLIRGENLTPEMKKQVLNAFPYRWTTGNSQRVSYYKCDKCDISNPYVNTESSEGHNHPTIPLITDKQWINDHSFYFTNDGRLAKGSAMPNYLGESYEG